MPRCINCDKEFEAKRSDAQLCSARCRQQARRKGVKLRGLSPPASRGDEKSNPVEKDLPAPLSSVPDKELLLPGDLGQVRTPAGVHDVQQAFFGNDGSVRLTVGPSYPSDYSGLLRVAKEGVEDIAAFKRHLETIKLTPNQKQMIYSKLT